MISCYKTQCILSKELFCSIFYHVLPSTEHNHVTIETQEIKNMLPKEKGCATPHHQTDGPA